MLTFFMGFGLCLFLCIIYRDHVNKKQEAKFSPKEILLTFKYDKTACADRQMVADTLRLCATECLKNAHTFCVNKTKDGWAITARDEVRNAVQYMDAATEVEAGSSFESGEWPDWLKSK